MTMGDDFYSLFTKPERATPVNGTVTPLDPERATRYAAKALSSECENVLAAHEGTRNHTLNKAAFSLGQLIAAGHLGRDDAWAALADAARGAGLTDTEIEGTLQSGLGAGQQLPRVVPDLPPPPAVTTLEDTEPNEEPLHASWAPQDPASILDGTYTPELPSLMPRVDKACLLYPGRVHSFHGESESGKSLIAQAEAVRTMEGGHDVLFIDFESDHAAVIGRLLELGAHRDEIRAHFTYLRPEVDPRRFQHEREAVATLLGRRYALAVIDGVTEALGVFGASTKDNDDITTFMRVLPRAVARETGAAVILVDHVTKDTEGRGRFAIGGQAKMAALDGAAFVVEVTEAIGRGLRGMVTLRVAKDRPGGVRANAGAFRKTDRTQEAARITVDSTMNDGLIHVSIGTPLEGEFDEFRPTHIMEKVSLFIEQAGDPLSTKTIEDGIDGRAETVRKAVALLVRDHFVRVETGARNARLHTSIQPYREARDPASSSFVTTLRDDLVRPRPDLVPDEVSLTSSQPLRSRAGRDEVKPPRTTSTSSRSQDPAFGQPELSEETP